MTLSATETLALLGAVAFTAGFVDAIAGGGGLLTVPALMMTGMSPHQVLATNKGQAVWGAVSSAVSFWRRGGIDRQRALYAFPLGFFGSLAGAFFVLLARPEPLRPVVLVLLVVAAVLVSIPREKFHGLKLRSPATAYAITSLVLGAYDGFFGPGVGSMLIVANVIIWGDTLTLASGNAKIVNLGSNLAAFMLFFVRGDIQWKIAIVMAVMNALGAAFGARLALSRGDKLVRVVVLLVVLVLVVKIAHSIVSPG